MAPRYESLDPITIARMIARGIADTRQHIGIYDDHARKLEHLANEEDLADLPSSAAGLRRSAELNRQMASELEIEIRGMFKMVERFDLSDEVAMQLDAMGVVQ